MTLEQLRQACELARIRTVPWGDGWTTVVRSDRFMHPEHPDERAWIESRCASVLVGRVFGQNRFLGAPCGVSMGAYETALRRECDHPLGATDEQKIRAAYSALTGEDLSSHEDNADD